MSTFALWRLFHRPGPRGSVRPHLGAGHRRLRGSHRHLPNRARRRARFHLAGLRRPYVRLHASIPTGRARCLRNMVRNPGARRQARRHGRRRPLDGRPGHSRHEHQSDGYVLLAAFACHAAHRAVRGARRLGGTTGGIPPGRTSRRTASGGRDHRSGDADSPRLMPPDRRCIGALIGIAGYFALMPADHAARPSRSSGSPSNSCGSARLALVVTLVGRGASWR